MCVCVRACICNAMLWYIAVDSADFTSIIPQSHLTIEKAAAHFCSHSLPFIQPATQCCWVDRGGLDLKLTQGFLRMTSTVGIEGGWDLGSSTYLDSEMIVDEMILLQATQPLLVPPPLGHRPKAFPAQLTRKTAL